MGIRKLNSFFHFYVFVFLIICHNHLAVESIPTSTDEWIEQQINGSVNVCKDILGTKWKNDSNKPLYSDETIKVCVPKKTAFPEYLDVDKDGKLKGGFSIAIFCLVLQELPFKIQHGFMPFTNQSYTEVVQKLESQDCDVVAGDISITSSRTQYADFTIAYMSSEIYMLVPAIRKWNQTLLTLIRPFTMKLWIAIISACVFIGVSVGFLEYRAKNPEFLNVPFFHKLFMIIWFPVSKFYFQEGRVHNRFSKAVLVVWLITIFIVMQIFTACLSSWLTVNQLQPKVPKKYHIFGYQEGSFVKDFVTNGHAQSYLSEDNVRVLSLSSLDDYKNVLDNHTVDAIFDEVPYIDIFLAKYGDNYMKIGPLASEAGIGFAFARESQLLSEFSRAVINVTESPDMTYMKKMYLPIQTPHPTKPDDSLPQSLDIHSFYILFIFMGLATIIAIICSEISLMHSSAQISPEISRNMMSAILTISANSKQIVEIGH